MLLPLFICQIRCYYFAALHYVAAVDAAFATLPLFRLIAACYAMVSRYYADIAAATLLRHR